MNSLNSWTDSLLWKDHEKIAKIALGTDTAQLFCPRHDIDVHIPSIVCRHVLDGAPVEHVGYIYGAGVGVYVHTVACQISHHSGTDFFAACPECLDELLEGHPKAMPAADRDAWEAQEAAWRDEETAS
jgi:hypothetical protein